MQEEIATQVLKSVSAIILLVVALVFIAVSIVLNYHWANYGIQQEKIKKVRAWYFGVSGVLLFAMAVALGFMIL